MFWLLVPWLVQFVLIQRSQNKSRSISHYFTFDHITCLTFCCLELTFVPYRVISFWTVTDVSDEAIAPTKMPMITRPISVHIIPKIRPATDLGARSP